MKPPLLFLCHRLPIPPNKGDKIRSYNMLKFLSEHYSIYLAGFIDDKNDRAYIDQLKQFCVDFTIEEKSPLLSKIKGLSGFLNGNAITLPYYHSSSLQGWISRAISEHKIERVFVYSSAMAQYVMPKSENSFTRFVMDFVDVDSDKWRQYALNKQGLGRWFYNREARCLENFEAQVFEAADNSVFVSSQEADFFNELMQKRKLDTHLKPAQAINNGVDADYFNPEAKISTVSELGQQAIVFTGAMDYWPNVAAVMWFVKHVWPQVSTSYPNAQFVVVGSNPTDEISQLSKQQNISVTGRVEDVRPYILQANVVIAPLQIARGIQNKVLEGMAMGKEIVLTKLAGEGICVSSMQGYHICETSNETVVTINKLLASLPAEIASNRQFVKDNFDWDTELQKLKGMIQ
ncbi:TIGR03087 family PEP-CTERM/XrtA system glycosyltransferase [Glaciecola sp. 2405UD65-10]|uniref:TIGR03087 family PEP-CTERM/XrtA system glycosyltransferase n=1 Tax=Glaciecola sp. 2405UD65-10 TaxID=3397244 RepID=UPI003B5BB0AC